MKRGDLITVALSGDFGKPRPAIVIQSDRLAETSSVLICPITSTLRESALYRLALPANDFTGLRKPSHVMIDKLISVPRQKCGSVIGRVDDAVLLALNRAIALVTGIADG